MIFVENLDQDSSDINPIHSPGKQLSSLDDLSSIQQFLDAKVFQRKIQNQDSTQSTPQNQKAQIVQKGKVDNQNHETEAASNQKSIFHNFQKHLITLLRKVIDVTLRSTGQNQEYFLALLLWNVFKKVQSYNKQTLHIIFGVSNLNSFEAELQKIANKYRQFRPIWNKYSSDQIYEAQRYIRNQVVQQMKHFNKNRIRVCCNVHKFETFYQYFESFLLELQEGPISSRMSKTRKLIVLQKIKNKPSVNDV